MKYLFSVVLVACRLSAVVSQVPGGNAAGLAVWFKADNGAFTDAGTMPAGNGGLVQQWNNLAPAATLNALQPTDALKPIWVNPGFNYNPVLSSAADRYLTLSGLNLTTAVSGAGAFVVYNYANVSQGSFASGPLSTLQAVSGGAVPGNFTFESSNFGGGVFEGRRINVTGSGENTFFGFTTVVTSSVAKNTAAALHLLWKSGGGSLDYKINGSTTGSASSGGSLVYSDLNVFRGWRNASSSTTGGQLPHIMDGNIAEIALYSGSLTPASVNKIETYLALKYGLTLSHNYINTADLTVFDVSSNNQDILGIARNETDEGFLQKQSHTADDATRIYTGSLANSNPENTTLATDFGSDRSYVVMGHDAGVACTNAPTATEKPVTVDKRLDREWKITNTNFSGTFSVSFDVSACTDFVSLPASQLLLLVDDDGDFTNATVYSPVSGASFSTGGGRIDVLNLNTLQIPANSTKFITLGTLPVTPTPVKIIRLLATLLNQQVTLTWQTATDPDSDFILEKSQDGTHFQELTILKTSDLPAARSYSFTDTHPFAGINYYRLRQSDDAAYTKTVSIFVNGKETITLFPNPARDFIHLDFSTETEAGFRLTDASGKGYPVQIEKEKKRLQAGHPQPGKWHLFFECSYPKTDPDFLVSQRIKQPQGACRLSV